MQPVVESIDPRTISIVIGPVTNPLPSAGLPSAPARVMTQLDPLTGPPVSYVPGSTAVTSLAEYGPAWYHPSVSMRAGRPNVGSAAGVVAADVAGTAGVGAWPGAGSAPEPQAVSDNRRPATTRGGRACVGKFMALDGTRSAGVITLR